MKNIKRLIVAAVLLTAGNAAAGWECYQQTRTTTEVIMQAENTDSGSSMYTSDGRLKSNREGSHGSYRSNGNSSYSNSGNSSYKKVEVIHYFTVCEDNGRIVSIIEHK